MKNKLFLFFAMLSAMLICGEYAVTRPISNALFLTAFSSKAYPWVWLATVPLNLLVIYLYNRLLPKIGPLRIFLILASLVIGINVFTSLFATKWPALIFLQFAWKDIYILLMLKQLWSMIHATISAKAKTLYGVIYATGTCGAVAGSLVPATLASSLGSELILSFTLPIYLAAMGAYTLAFRNSQITDSFQQELTENPKPSEALSLIKNTPTLLAILFLVVCMQVSVGLMEYQFNAHLEQNILDKDLRAAYFGKLIGIMNLSCLVLQTVGTFLLLKTLGLKRTHIAIPVLLLGTWLITLIFPAFGMISFAYIFLKTVDFSLFNIAREMLYAPLPLDAKYRAKAIIDVFAYRSSKAIMSVGILGLQAVAGVYLLQLTSVMAIAVFIAWLFVALFFFSKKRGLKSIQQ